MTEKIEITCLVFFRVKGRPKKSIYQAKMTSIIDEWRAISAYHTTCLEHATEAAQYHAAGMHQAHLKIQELTAAAAAPAAAAPAAAAAAAPVAVELHLSNTEFKQRVIQMAANDSKKYKARWNKLIASGLIQNVQAILDECYDPLRLKDSNPEGWKAARELGARGSVKWQKFCLRIIQRLKVEGSFGLGSDDDMNDFEDTASGCDETLWNAACYLLEHPEAAVAPV